MKYVTESVLLDNEVLKDSSITDLLEHQPENLQDKLFKMIKDKNLDEVQIYKDANISRQLFSKIRSEKNYHPSKNTIFSLAIGMKLNIDEASELLDSVGYIFTSTSKTDLIVQYFLYHKNYNIFEINEVLDKYGLDIL